MLSVSAVLLPTAILFGLILNMALRPAAAARLSVLRRETAQRLTRFLRDESIRDGVIQGGSVRLVLSREALEKERYGLSLTEPSEAVAVNPSFEDGFIDRLGGIVQRSSPLAQGFHSIPKSEKPPVVAEGLTKRYGSFTAADRITFTMEQGKFSDFSDRTVREKVQHSKCSAGFSVRPREPVTFPDGTCANHRRRRGRGSVTWRRNFRSIPTFRFARTSIFTPVFTGCAAVGTGSLWTG